jgi:hypothetical protein
MFYRGATMKAIATLIASLALVSIAKAEQGDAEDRALIEQMMQQKVTHEKQPALTQPDAGYGGGGKTGTQSGRSVPKEKSSANNGE